MKNVHRFFALVFLLGSITVSSGLMAHGPGAGPGEATGDIVVTRHFSGLWDQPDHQSQGFTLHVVHQFSGERIAVAFWFSYGEDRESDWLLGRGPVIGNRVELDLYRFSGVEFLQQNDPEFDAAEIVGSALMEFDSCQTGTVTYNTEIPGKGEGSFRIEQSGWILNTHCSGGLSDDMPMDAAFGQQWVELLPAREEIQGSGHARFESHPNHMELEVETEGLPDGNFRLHVGTVDRGGFTVQNGYGEITFSSPGEDGHELLNFEPRGQRIEVRDASGVALSSFENVINEDDHSPYRGGHGRGHGHDADHDYTCDDDAGPGDGMGGGHGDGHGGGMGGNHGGYDCVEEGDFIEVEVNLESTGILAGAKGEAEWEMNSHRVRFSVEIEGVPVGDYALRVGGLEVGVIETFLTGLGDVFGRIGFRDPAVYGMAHLDFDPRGQKIEVLQGETVILEVDFPAE